MYDARKIGNLFLSLYEAHGIEVKRELIMGMVYVAHARSLGWRNKPLISGRIEAWHYGPVIPSIYYGLARTTVTNEQDGTKKTFFPKMRETGGDVEAPVLRLVNEVFNEYKGFSVEDFRKILGEKNEAVREAMMKKGALMDETDIRCSLPRIESSSPSARLPLG